MMCVSWCVCVCHDVCVMSVCVMSVHYLCMFAMVYVCVCHGVCVMSVHDMCLFVIMCMS
jgi:hypothetical protein